MEHHPVLPELDIQDHLFGPQSEELHREEPHPERVPGEVRDDLVGSGLLPQNVLVNEDPLFEAAEEMSGQLFYSFVQQFFELYKHVYGVDHTE